MRRKRLIGTTAASVAALTLLAAFDPRLRTVTYRVPSRKVGGPVRLAVLTDLHSCAYGKGQRTLLDAVAAQAPDAVLLAGDIVDDQLPEENAWTALRALAAAWPCFCVTGNHAYYGGEADRICRRMEGLGVTVLRGASKQLTLKGQPLTICGVDDPRSGESAAQLRRVGAAVQADRLTVLLSHRPECISHYLAYPFDLIVSGHAHGGQWRIPGVLNGLLAPGQGLFPRYAGGRYDFGRTVLLVSRGLARESTWVPRIFNRPELVVADIVPAGPAAGPA